jgi:hypothetical protein
VPDLVWIDLGARPEQLLAALGEPGAELPAEEQAARADRFLAGLGGLALRLRGEPPPAAFVSDSAARLPSCWAGVLRFRDGLLDRLRDAFVADEWRQSCERRTALQELVELYGERPGLPLFELELDRVDELLRHRGETEGFLLEQEIPEGIPATHWWWQLPDRG